MKLSKRDKDNASNAFLSHSLAIHGFSNKAESVKTLHLFCHKVSNEVRPIVLRVIDAQYEMNLTHEECVSMLEKIATETVE